MRVTADVVGEDATDVELDDGATYADLCRALGYSPHEVAVLVDDRPVPADRPVDVERVRLLRLVRGG